MHTINKKCFLVSLLLLLLGTALFFASCGEDEIAPKEDVTTITVLLRDSATGAHHQVDVKLWQLNAEDRALLAQLQDKGVRITVSVPKAPLAMTEDERLALVKEAINAYHAQENNEKPIVPSNPVDPNDPITPPDDPIDPDDNNNSDVNDDNNNSDNNKPEPMKEPITLNLCDTESGKSYTFIFDAVNLSAVEKNLVKEQCDRGVLTMAVSKDPAEMSDDEKKALLDAVIVLLSYVPPSPPVPHATVFVDAGHGYTNSYGVVDKGSGDGSPYHALTGLYESDLNLMIALHLKEKLIKAGFAVIMSREGEVNEHLTINDRARMINASGADFVVSVHCNSASPAAKGARVYWHSNNDEADISKAYAEKVADAINEIGGITNKKAYADEGSYAVVRDVHMASVLVETCFLTNEEDAKMASDPRFAERMAEALCQGICRQFIKE